MLSFITKRLVTSLLVFCCPEDLGATQGLTTPEEALKLYGEEAWSKSKEMTILISNQLKKDSPSCPAQIDFQGNHLTKDEILIFVSFSMPEASLKKLHEEAKVLGGRLVIRGLKENNFTQTAQILKRLGISVDIDPELFTKHNVSYVPQFIKIEDGQKVMGLQGNVSLRYALERFKETRT